MSKWYITYQGKEKNAPTTHMFSFGSCCLDMNGVDDLWSEEAINICSNYIKESQGYSELIITNWIKIKEK